jgi:hypothetical protein
MNRARFLISAPEPEGPAALVEMRPFMAALSCDDGVIAITLQSYCSRTLRLDLFAACDDGGLAHEVLPRPNLIELGPGASASVRIGLRLGALHVERAFCLVLREISLRRDAPSFTVEMSLPLTVTPVQCVEALRAA